VTTTSDLIQETKRHLQSGAREEMNKLTSDPGTGTTLAFDFALGGIATGAVLAAELELIYVWSVTGSQATVQRGYLGTTAVAHGAGTLVYVNPKFSDFAIFRALSEEIQSYSSPVHGLFRMKAIDITYNTATAGYDLAGITDLIDVYDLRWKGYTTGDWPRIRRWTTSRNMATTEFASGQALLLYDEAGPGRTIRVVYKAKYGALSATLASDVETATGLHGEAHDIPPLGAAARLVAPREVKRSFTESQPESRAAAEVPPGTSTRAAGLLLQLRNQRLREEAARLSAAYPALARSA
jgi:hypothetical protein